MSDLKLGKRPPVPDPRDFHLEKYALDLAAVPPAHDLDNVRRLQGAGDLGMLGNDRYGDCVWAGADHETELALLIAGADANAALRLFSADTALEDYAAVTGFRRNDPSTDQGTDVRQALSYRRRTGIEDVTGKRHQIAAYVSVEPGNVAAVKEAVHLTDVVGIGFEVPSYAMDQFDRGHPWTLTADRNPTIEGGHYVPVVGYSYRRVYVVTWGRVQPMSWGFFRRFCDEAWAVLLPEFLSGGKSPEGFDLAALEADLAAL